MSVLLRLPTPQSSAFCSLWFSRCPLRVCSSKAAHLLRATTMRHPSSGEIGGGESGWLPTRSTSRHCWKHVRITHTPPPPPQYRLCIAQQPRLRASAHKNMAKPFDTTSPSALANAHPRGVLNTLVAISLCRSALFHLWPRVRVCSQGLPRQVLWMRRVTPTAPCSSVGWHLKPTRRSCSGSSNRTGPFPR